MHGYRNGLCAVFWAWRLNLIQPLLPYHPAIQVIARKINGFLDQRNTLLPPFGIFYSKMLQPH